LSFDHGLKAGDVISNNKLVSIFLCGPQGGMRRSHRTNSLVIISDHTKSVYEDRWAADDIIHYTGMGLEGDQSLEVTQNKTLSESDTNAVGCYLFEVYDSRKYLFRGKIVLAGNPYQETQPDKNDVIRKVWVFSLRVAMIRIYHPLLIKNLIIFAKLVISTLYLHNYETTTHFRI
jgi:5-methylcytosine-specific restriction protein A